MSNRSKIKLPEILAPAGNMDQATRSIDAGCDALYGGLKSWNARMRAANFSLDEYNRLMELCRERGVKFYMTLNTLFRDDELDAVERMFSSPGFTLPDAVIAADIGLIKMLSRNFPALDIHASTQFGAFSVDDMEFLKRFRVSRVILARELTLNEITDIRAQTDLKLEVFVYGSQCVCFSGQCLWSGLTQECSGNRGRCTAPCRDFYRQDQIEGQLMYPQDIDASSIVKRLIDIGIDSMKIEGRFRDAETTARIVRTFRNAVDNPVEPSDDRYVGYLGNTVPVKGMFHTLNPRLKYKRPIFATELTPLNDGATITIKFDERTLKTIELLDNLGRQYLFPCSSCAPIEMTASDAVDALKSKLNFKILEITSNAAASSTVLVDLSELLTVSNGLNEKCEGKLVAKPMPSKMPAPTVEDFIQLDSAIDMKYLKGVGYRNFIFDITSTEELNAALNIENSIGTIIYRLPLLDFNGLLEKILPKLRGKLVMITRISQLKHRKIFSRVIAEYTLNIWNSEALNLLKQLGVEMFTAHPELSIDESKIIADKVGLPMNMIAVGRIPLGYTRACFGEMNLCDVHCGNSVFELENVDKGYEIQILCNNAFGYRTILSSNINVTATDGDCRRRYILSQMSREDRRLISEGQFDDARLSSIYGRSVL